MTVLINGIDLQGQLAAVKSYRQVHVAEPRNVLYRGFERFSHNDS